jgi:WD40 repeat protein
MNKGMKVLLAAALAVVAMSSAALAAPGTSFICAYTNNNVGGATNSVSGYKIGHGSTIGTLIGPVSTNGQGIGGGFYLGGLGATKIRGYDLYVNDAATDNITHFTINKKDCTLTLDTTHYPSGDTGVVDGDGLAISPDGKFMFVGASGNFSLYSIAIGANGSLGAPVFQQSTSDYPTGITVSPDGKTLVVSYIDILQVCAYPISGGTIGTPNCQSAAGFVTGVTVDINSACVYAAEANTSVSELAAFTLTGGVLGAPTDYNPFGPGVNSNGIKASRSNKNIYLTNTYSAQITTGAISAGCGLTYTSIQTDGSAGNGDNPGEVAQAPRASGYVVTGDYNPNNTAGIGVFTEGAGGVLTPVAGSPFTLGGVTASMTVAVVGSK